MTTTQTPIHLLQKEALSVAEFCDVFGITRHFAQGLINDGKVHSVRAGRRRLISVRSARVWFDELIAAEQKAVAQ